MAFGRPFSRSVKPRKVAVVKLTAKDEHVDVRLTFHITAEPGLVLDQNHGKAPLNAELGPGERASRFELSMERVGPRKPHREQDHQIPLARKTLALVAFR